jgi:sulfate permease, SulP family
VFSPTDGTVLNRELDSGRKCWHLGRHHRRAAVAAFFALRNVARRSSAVREDLPAAMSFGVAERISSAIIDADHPRTSAVVIRMSQLGMLDATGAHTLAQISTELEARGITLIIKGVRPERMNVLTNVDVIDSLRHENHLLDSLDDAIVHARTHVAHQPH